jgi:hypothetical protein
MPWIWGKKQDDEEEEYTGDEDSQYESDDQADDEASVASSQNDHGEVDSPNEQTNPSSQQPVRADQSTDNHSRESNNEDEDDEDISLIDVSSGVDTLSDDLFESSSEEEEENDDSQQPSPDPNKIQHSQSLDDATTDEDDDDEVPTSFWEKQSLLILAAEHDRVDILNGILTGQDEDKERLMNSGIPPLHLSITFGSVNATVALLRMGADPSVRPIIEEVLKEQKEQPEDSKVEIPHIQRFDGASAWELAFGNKSYHDVQKYKNSKSWSLFGSSTSSLEGSSNNKAPKKPPQSARIIKPVDMPPSKREGVRHAFTAEALRTVGSDEVERLKQLVDSGMPATIDIGGKDLYGWAVEMGALKCEELLRPSEAAKYGKQEKEDQVEDSVVTGGNAQTLATSTSEKILEHQGSSFVVHRPTEETVPELNNRLDELESLSAALSSCLDNLAEEVSVCHGLLLMGGGATALASHVKSLKALKEQKLAHLEEAQAECQDLGRELTDLVHSSGKIGSEIAETPAFKLFKTVVLTTDGNDSEASEQHGKASTVNANEMVRKSLVAQIAASENKIRKLRASIADLSEENARDMQEVERRGLQGGITLVRGLREDVRDIDFHLGEFRSTKMEYKTKINMIRARVPSQQQQYLHSFQKATCGVPVCDQSIPSSPPKTATQNATEEKLQEVPLDSRTMMNETSTNSNKDTKQQSSPAQNGIAPERNVNTEPFVGENGRGTRQQQMTLSEKIATGDSQALAVIHPGNQGFFTVDLWQVILRIIGFDRAAYRRGIQVAGSQPNVMIV